MPTTRFIANEETHQSVIVDAVNECQQFLWIATSDIKDMHIKRGRRAIPFLQRLSELVDVGISIRLIHAKEPGPAFREDYDRFPNLIDGMEMILCPRAHFKSIIVDGRLAYTGSANLTGAGLGMKSKDRRNFEGGILSDDPELVRPIMQQFDTLWIGGHCPSCQRKAHCATYHELIGAE
ncbi:phospholipase D family protein [Pelagicoccus sp. SDUM812003]|uniref:phospholipase D family protein n=1 Tax=Pelagicoccus sp. SDUM812003 TaxID=3041267 RepID=UPI00280EC78A|nr:phospholipase D family protein [Pelagicoccus sp. SDUM812003]MDQ8201390.1 phospholipase D family protein [Pelagicoccus sp. SDUM812003]